ncbi:ABC transporter transmembrane domain-containing protein, partial [Microbacterium sp.]|uniref:ABC transporter transmembrane domain-containing protein n=1 Tax=Microbacterium sp. TaxID=51671 RepID=UPI0039E2CB33
MPRLPQWIQAPAEPIRVRPLRIDERTTARSLTLRVIGSAPRFTVPAALLSITHQLGEALVPVIMGLAIDQAVRTGDPARLLLWIVLLAVDFAVLSFSYRFGSRIGQLGMLAVQHHLREIVSAHLLRREPARAAWSAPGVALSLATSDVNRLAGAVAIGVYPAGELAAIVFGGAVLLTISWPLGLAVLLGAPAMLWMTDAAGSALRRRSAQEQAAAADAAGRAADLMTGYRVVKGVHAEAEASARYRRTSRAALASTLHARQAEGVFTGTMSLATGLFLTAIAVAAGLLAVEGAFGLGALVTVIGLTQFLLSPLENFARNAGAVWAAGTASAGRLLTLLREQPDAAPPAPAAIAEVAASALDGDDAIVAIDAEGQEAIDVLRAVRALRADAVIVPHEAHLFVGSVRDNVELPGVDAARATAALAAAQCDDFVDALPEGVDTVLGEGGTGLSGGQRQRTALARALAQDAELLVLHDPTSAVDAVTEAAIAAGLAHVRRGR